MKKAFLVFVLMSVLYVVKAQQATDITNYPIVGKVCPDFILHHINYYSKKSASLKDFSGKWLILDFWNKECGACIASFPKINALQQTYKDDIQWMLVGIQDPEKQIEPMFARFRAREHLVIPCAFDSLLANRWEIHAAPHLVIIDPKGIVRGITAHLTSDDIKQFISGGSPHLFNPYTYDFEKDTTILFDPQKPYLLNGNGGRDTSFLIRSVLSKYDGTIQKSYTPATIEQDSAYGKFQVLGCPLVVLYNYAYYGKIWPDEDHHLNPVLELRDTTSFVYSNSSSHNLFCYSLNLPHSQGRKARFQKILQAELESYFGYVATVEDRKFTSWRLLANEHTRQRMSSKGGKSLMEFTIPKIKFSAVNYPFKNIVIALQSLTGQTMTDDSGISGNVDMKMDAMLTNIYEVKKELAKWGIELLPYQKDFKVLVIKDSKPN